MAIANPTAFRPHPSPLPLPPLIPHHQFGMKMGNNDEMELIIYHVVGAYFVGFALVFRII